MPLNVDEAPESSAATVAADSLEERRQCDARSVRLRRMSACRKNSRREKTVHRSEMRIEKSEKGGFGIYFTKRDLPGGAPFLVVDGFVEDVRHDEALGAEEEGDAGAGESDEKKKAAIRELLQLGDALVGISGVDCQRMEVMEIIALLRAAPLGSNTLQFSRERVHDDSSESETNASETKGTSASITKCFIGALRKVKTKIREGIEGDEELLLREQEEKELFEKSWLAEFDRLKREHETKWETCTYTADEFCGLLYHSGDQQQKEHLLREYPLLMESWKNADLSATPLRVRPDWPVPKVACAEAIEYRPATSSSCESGSMSNSCDGSALSPPPPAQLRDICCSPPLRRALETLHHDFVWHRCDVLAFEKRLESADILSCTDLMDALEARSGFFERAFQSEAHPRLAKAICRALHAHARHSAKTHEDLSGRIGGDGFAMKQQLTTVGS